MKQELARTEAASAAAARPAGREADVMPLRGTAPKVTEPGQDRGHDRGRATGGDRR